MLFLYPSLSLIMANTKTSQKLLSEAYPKRSEWSAKGDYGKVLVVGGSAEYSGSPIFNCMAAYAAGADLVTLLAPRRAANIAASYAPEIIAPPLEGDFLQPSHLQRIISACEKNDALVIGGGLSRHGDTKTAVLDAIERTSIPAVIDADALRFITESPGMIYKRQNLILTPHTDELRTLVGTNVPNDKLPARIEAAKNVARELDVVVLLKGATDVITDGKRVMLDFEGSPYLTKGGIGDATAGVCGALLARGIKTFEAAATASFIIGKAGKAASKIYGESLLPTHVIAELPKAIMQA